MVESSDSGYSATSRKLTLSQWDATITQLKKHWAGFNPVLSKDKARLVVSQLSAIATNCRNANRALRGKSKKPRSANLRKLKTTSLIFLFSFALRGLKNIPTHRTHSHKKMKLDRRVKVEIWHGFFVPNTTLIRWLILLKRLARVWWGYNWYIKYLYLVYTFLGDFGVKNGGDFGRFFLYLIH